MKKLMKTLTVLMCAVALVAGSVAGTFAWLTAKTDTIANTFTAGNINITLTESDYDENVKMVPGVSFARDPKVTVVEESEACWLFVKVEEPTNFGTFMTYSIADDWTPVAGAAGVYYREVAYSDEDQEYWILKDNKIVAKEATTKDEYDGITSIELKYTAYAVQKSGFATAAAAWEEAKLLG